MLIKQTEKKKKTISNARHASVFTVQFEAVSFGKFVLHFAL